MRLRGQSARLADLKSYKVILNSKAPWDGFVKVNLNKHPFDDLRIRNKLTFELIKNIPNITSARTQFVHLFVKDFSEGDYSKPYEDYGLFTQIENIDTRYLENHNLDQYGYLYKVENFEFKRYEDILKDVTDPSYDEGDFEDILEIKGLDDHKKLLNMLDDVNNDFVNINRVIDTHFDSENFLTWLALNILTDNVDTQTRNYFLYSPSETSTWYFLPWDYDKSLGGYSTNRPIWTKGVSNYWGNVLINRFLRNDNNLVALTQKVEELALILNEKEMDKYIDIYKEIALEYLHRYPDNTIDNDSDEELEAEFKELRGSMSVNKIEYYKSVERPMPVFLDSPYLTGNFMEFRWSSSYDFQDDLIYYSFELSDSPNFENNIYEKSGLLTNEIIVKRIPAGHYFYRVYITDSKGNKSDAFDIYFDDEALTYHYGVKDFYVN
jgi:spore coat protein H